jgi:DNA polymerase I-like protein with 3'-5' exonuclease and polymerase domains
MKLTTSDAYELLHRGTLALADVERAGVRVDMTYLDKTVEEIKGKITRMEAKMRNDKEVYRVWSREYGQKTNIGSRDQLAKVLFKNMGYEAKEYTAASYDEDGRLRKDARAKTDKDALDDIDLPFVQKFLKVENLKKTLTTYLYGIKREAVLHHDREWYAHCVYNLHIASTYRSTCDNFNFQNQPKRDEEMANFVRRCFLPHPGDVLVEVDFSTLEVKISYCYNKDPNLRKYLLDSKTDMHRDSASDLFMLPIDLLIEHAAAAKKTVRDSAKNQFVFPEFYGSVWFQCAKHIWKSMTRKKWTVPGSDKSLIQHLADEGTFARHVMEVEKVLWKKRFPAYDKWKRDYYEEYLRKGYFKMYTGFVVNTVHKKNDVTNYPVQGSASHCKLWCLIQMIDWLKKYKMKTKVVGEIHDSIVASVKPSELQDFLTYCKWVMTVALPRAWKWIIIPLEMEADVAAVNEPWNTQKQWVPDEEGEWSVKA